MDYKKIYDKLIAKAKNENRIKNNGIYYESHHIIPRCMGGSNKLENKVLLTGKEHFLAHRLLFKIFPDIIPIIKAYHAMFAHLQKRGYKPSSRVYGEMRESYAKNVKFNYNWVGKKHSLETRKKMSNSHKGKKMSEESKEKNRNKHLGKKMSTKTKLKISSIHKGKKMSEETKSKISITNKEKKISGLKKPAYNKGKKLSEEIKLKMSLSKKGKKLHKQTQETRKKISESMKRKTIK